MQIRGGSSKGLYFHAEDLPDDPEQRDRIILGAICGVGPDDIRQIDGLGGADPLTSKAGIISRSKRPDADLDYEFVQVVVGKGVTDRTQNCGNILAGVVPFALETGLIKADSPRTALKVFMKNSNAVCRVTVETPDGQITYKGTTRIDGVPGFSAPVICEYYDIAGGTCGSVFPTGNRTDIIDGVEATCIDAGMPLVIIRAADLGRSGYESRDYLDNDQELKDRLESIRLLAGKMMNLGDVQQKAVPKMTLIAPAGNGGVISTRSFIPHKVHAAVGVLAAVTAAAACVAEGTTASKIAAVPPEGSYLSVEHPSGEISISLDFTDTGGELIIASAGVVRTARSLSCGEVYLPEDL